MAESFPQSRVEHIISCMVSSTQLLWRTTFQQVIVLAAGRSVSTSNFWTKVHQVAYNQEVHQLLPPVHSIRRVQSRVWLGSMAKSIHGSEPDPTVRPSENKPTPSPSRRPKPLSSFVLLSTGLRQLLVCQEEILRASSVELLRHSWTSPRKATTKLTVADVSARRLTSLPADWLEAF